MTARMVAAVMAGGGIGATARYQIGLQFADRYQRIGAPDAPSAPTDFPWVTFLVNMGGALALGAVMTLLATAWLHTRYVKPFVATGVIGSFTTWSDLIVETDQLIGGGHVGVAIVYVVSSLVLGLLAAAIGAALVEAWQRSRREARS